MTSFVTDLGRFILWTVWWLHREEEEGWIYRRKSERMTRDFSGPPFFSDALVSDVNATAGPISLDSALVDVSIISFLETKKKKGVDRNEGIRRNSR